MKVISINIEGKKHLAELEEFLAQENAMIVCLMEVCQEDVLKIAGETYPFVVFAKNDILGNIRGSGESESPTGVAILSKSVIQESEKDNFGVIPRVFLDYSGQSSHAPVLLTAKIEGFWVGAVHFTWTSDGSVSDNQRKHLDLLLKKVANREMFLCGDFNIPRGNELYHKLNANFCDNIPREIDTTLDPILHYANRTEVGKLKFVVDYAWTTPQIKVKRVWVISGVSDHCAVVCQIAK